jgi:glycosyl transferase, family 25
MPTWPIFVISLRDAAARRAAISSQLDALGLDYEFFDAVDGRKGLPAEYEAMVDRPGTLATLGRSMGNAEYACALSHMEVYRRIVERSLPGAIVFEDDAIIGPLFPAFLRDEVYLQADLVQMDHLHARIWKMGKRRKLPAGFTLAAWAEMASLTTGYSISERGARHLLKHGLPLRATADWPCDLESITPMATLPRIVDHPPNDTGTSTLEKARAQARGSVQTRKSAKRFMKINYWRRWVFKRLTKRVS